MKKSFKTSLWFYFPLAIILGLITFSSTDKIVASLIVGFVGAMSVFFVPILFKNMVDKKVKK